MEKQLFNKHKALGFSVAEKWERARDKDQGKKERREGENKSHLPS